MTNNLKNNRQRQNVVRKKVNFMKTRLLTILFALIIGLGNVTTSRASEDKSIATIADIAIVRPACLAVTIVGSAVFVVALPIAAVSGSVKETADTLVGRPAAATFTRPLGDFTSLN